MQCLKIVPISFLISSLFFLIHLLIIGEFSSVFGSPNFTVFITKTYPVFISILFIGWGGSFHALSHLVRLNFAEIGGGENDWGGFKYSNNNHNQYNSGHHPVKVVRGVEGLDIGLCIPEIESCEEKYYGGIIEWRDESKT